MERMVRLGQFADPSCYKQQFLLYDVFGYEHSEIAGLLGCSIGCSKSQLHKARKRLRCLLQGEQGRAETSVAAASGGNPASTVGIGVQDLAAAEVSIDMLKQAGQDLLSSISCLA